MALRLLTPCAARRPKRGIPRLNQTNDPPQGRQRRRRCDPLGLGQLPLAAIVAAGAVALGRGRLTAARDGRVDDPAAGGHLAGGADQRRGRIADAKAAAAHQHPTARRRLADGVEGLAGRQLADHSGLGRRACAQVHRRGGRIGPWGGGQALQALHALGVADGAAVDRRTIAGRDHIDAARIAGAAIAPGLGDAGLQRLLGGLLGQGRVGRLHAAADIGPRRRAGGRADQGAQGLFVLGQLAAQQSAGRRTDQGAAFLLLARAFAGKQAAQRLGLLGQHRCGRDRQAGAQDGGDGQGRGGGLARRHVVSLFRRVSVVAALPPSDSRGQHKGGQHEQPGSGEL
ncbi:hypothetical protein CC_0354 [Caulobacter vibrioides CB15]|uniref:Uncharacterized protein n=1 Tax=Caulobacter vibrioides (strain ATCC 19089 / CIP 103742 / CB 15) TaxID=190650 RepID=Q9AB77_CAUVC|nr:hypothetical protein CC_0354 [Caulobacter vibrioides CB15]